MNKYVVFSIVLGFIWGILLLTLGMWSLVEVVLRDNISVSGTDRNLGKAVFVILFAAPFTTAGAAIMMTCWEFLTLARAAKPVKESRMYQRVSVVFNPSSRFWRSLLGLTVPLLGILPVIKVTDDMSRTS